MLTIWKFTLPGTLNGIAMDPSAEILDVQCQSGQLVMWALVDTAHTPVPRTFEVFGTGWELPPHKRTHIATVQDGGLVWHVFEQR